MGSVSVWLGNRLFDEYHSGVNYTWQLMRTAVCQHAWDELCEGQKEEWVREMDSEANLSSRVWVNYFEQVIELRYERYYEDTYHLTSHASFVIIADYDSFRRCCPGLNRVRGEWEPDPVPCLPML